MSIADAINNLTWMLKNRWVTSEKDIESFNTLIRFVNYKNSEQIKNNELKAKLYILSYGNYLKTFDTTKVDSIFQKEFHKLFDRPLSHFITDFQKDLNDREQYKLLKSKEFNMEHPLIVKDNQNRKDTEILYNILQNEDEKKTLFGQSWKYGVVENNLLSQINQFLDDYVQRNK